MKKIDKKQKNLARSLANCYKIFSAYDAPIEHIDACTACCMEPKLEKKMRTLPLREITVAHFDAHNDSAKSANQPAEEIKYFLPRMLEVIAEYHKMLIV